MTGDDEPAEQFVGVYFATNSVDDHIDEWARLMNLLDEAVEASGLGELDGHCDENDEQAVFAYGPDAEALFKVIEPIVRAFPARPARVTLRFGAAEDESAIERDFDL